MESLLILLARGLIGAEDLATALEYQVIEELLRDYAAGDQPATRPNPALRVVDAGGRN